MDDEKKTGESIREKKIRIRHTLLQDGLFNKEIYTRRLNEEGIATSVSREQQKKEALICRVKEELRNFEQRRLQEKEQKSHPESCQKEFVPPEIPYVFGQDLKDDLQHLNVDDSVIQEILSMEVKDVIMLLFHHYMRGVAEELLEDFIPIFGWQLDEIAKLPNHNVKCSEQAVEGLKLIGNGFLERNFFNIYRDYHFNIS